MKTLAIAAVPHRTKKSPGDSLTSGLARSYLLLDLIIPEIFIVKCIDGIYVISMCLSFVFCLFKQHLRINLFEKRG